MRSSLQYGTLERRASPSRSNRALRGPNRPTNTKNQQSAHNTANDAGGIQSVTRLPGDGAHQEAAHEGTGHAQYRRHQQAQALAGRESRRARASPRPGRTRRINDCHGGPDCKTRATRRLAEAKSGEPNSRPSWLAAAPWRFGRCFVGSGSRARGGSEVRLRPLQTRKR